MDVENHGAFRPPRADALEARGQGDQGGEISGRRTAAGQSGLVPALAGEQTLAATLPQLRHAALPDAMA